MSQPTKAAHLNARRLTSVYSRLSIFIFSNASFAVNLSRGESEQRVEQVVYKLLQPPGGGVGRVPTAVVIVLVTAGYIRGGNWTLVSTVLSRLLVAAGAAASHY